jgi:hypothetical protein
LVHTRNSGNSQSVPIHTSITTSRPPTLSCTNASLLYVHYVSVRSFGYSKPLIVIPFSETDFRGAGYMYVQYHTFTELHHSACISEHWHSLGLWYYSRYRRSYKANLVVTYSFMIHTTHVHTPGYIFNPSTFKAGVISFPISMSDLHSPEL